MCEASLDITALGPEYRTHIVKGAALFGVITHKIENITNVK